MFFGKFSAMVPEYLKKDGVFMLVGIDVGGTYTDAVLLDSARVIKKAKVATRHDNLLQCLLAALDQIIKDVAVDKIKRVALSTTLITNLIAEKKYDPVAMILIPGPGLNLNMYHSQTISYIADGAIDFRGREIIPLNKNQLKDIIKKIHQQGYAKIAVVGKFSQRNNQHELAIKDMIKQDYPDIEVALGHQVSGQLNFPRRIATTFLTLASRGTYRLFSDAVREALKERKITAPVVILKADGCTLPLAASLEMPVETIFSGPAASTLGVMAMTPKGQTSVLLDIGGTTTDLAIILSGVPLLSSRGVRIERFLTNVKSFAVRSVPIGGDSVVTIENNEIVILPERRGVPYCQGGPQVTPTDALRVLGKSKIGNLNKALEGMQLLGTITKMSEEEVAEQILNLFVNKIIVVINAMFHEWEEEPAYRVWEVLQEQKIRPQNMVGVGGAAAGIIPLLARRMGCRPIIPENADVANAIGAAVARPTVMISLRVDTEHGQYSVIEEGFQGPLPRRANYKEEDVMNLALEWFAKRAKSMGINLIFGDIEVLENEVFNIVRDWSTIGKIFKLSIQNSRGILAYIQGGASNDK